MNDEQINSHLERVKDLQFSFKSDTVQRYACRVVRTAVDNGAFWPDEVKHEDIPKRDRNCIGSTFRMLCNVGIIQREGD